MISDVFFCHNPDRRFCIFCHFVRTRNNCLSLVFAGSSPPVVGGIRACAGAKRSSTSSTAALRDEHRWLQWSETFFLRSTPKAVLIAALLSFVAQMLDLTGFWATCDDFGEQVAGRHCMGLVWKASTLAVHCSPFADSLVVRRRTNDQGRCSS